MVAALVPQNRAACPAGNPVLPASPFGADAIAHVFQLVPVNCEEKLLHNYQKKKKCFISFKVNRWGTGFWFLSSSGRQCEKWRVINNIITKSILCLLISSHKVCVWYRWVAFKNLPAEPLIWLSTLSNEVSTSRLQTFNGEMYFFQCIVRNCQLVSDVENSPYSQLIGKRATKRLHTSRLWKASWMGRDTGWRSQAMSFLQIERHGNSPLLIPCRKQCESDPVGVSNPCLHRSEQKFVM